MYTPLHCIALRTVRYNDRNSILTVYTRENGRMSLLVPAGKGKTAARYRALTMPMMQFECVATIRPGNEVHTFKDLRPTHLITDTTPVHPLKSVVAFFLADFFSSLMREPLHDNASYSLISETATMLWQSPAEKLPNLHILALLRTLTVIGIEPDTSTYAPGKRFNLNEGIWTRELVAPPHHKLLTPGHSQFLATLLRMDKHNFHRFRFNRDERNLIVDNIIEYIARHGAGKLKLTSLEVLRELF